LNFNPESFVSPVIKNLPPWGIGKFFELLSQNDDVVSLALGEPAHLASWVIRSEAIESLRSGETKYSSNYGLTELRATLAAYLVNRFNVCYDPKDEIIVTIGGSQALDLAVRTIISRDDEVLIPTPCYASYGPCVTMTGGIPIPVPTKEQDGHKVSPELLKKYLSPNTKAIILNYPNNPTGAIMQKADLEPLAQFIIKHNLMVISDEIYAEFTYGTNHYSIAALPGMRDRTLLINGFSKTFALTGFRIGYLCAHRSLIPHMIKIHQCNVLCLPVMIQRAAIAAITSCFESVLHLVEEYDCRRKIIMDRLNKMGLPTIEPQGAFYIFPSIKNYNMSSEEFAHRLLFESRVAVIPGSVFGPGGEGFIRCSYSGSEEEIMTALDRMECFCNSLG